jgi:hypothetical protein
MDMVWVYLLKNHNEITMYSLVKSPLSPSDYWFSFTFYYITMSAYAEDILCMVCDASGPSIRDMEVIRSFQSHPTTKDAVSVSFCSFHFVMVLILDFFF